MRHMSTLALVELLTQVVEELNERGTSELGEEGLVNGGLSIATAWGDLEIQNRIEFVWNSEGDAETALRDRGRVWTHSGGDCCKLPDVMIEEIAREAIARNIIDEKVASGALVRTGSGGLIEPEAVTR
jgi:hypothetical protein